MIQLLIIVFAATFWVCGLFLASTPEFILNPFANFLDKKLGALAKPIITCVTCMSGLHTLLVAFILWQSGLVVFSGYKQFLLQSLVCVPIVAFWVSMMWNIFNFVFDANETRQEEIDFYYQEELESSYN